MAVRFITAEREKAYLNVSGSRISGSARQVPSGKPENCRCSFTLWSAAYHDIRAMPRKVKGDNKIKAGLVPQEKL
jgi:hypothetical protein